MPVLLLRHAHAGDRDRWQDDDRVRPLAPEGKAQAEALVDRLAPFTLDAVLSSPAVRCVQTVEPLAAVRGLVVGRREELFEGRGPVAVRFVELLVGEHVVLCTHGDIVPAVLVGLVRSHGTVLSEPPRWPKGSSWVLEDDGERFVSARYLPPPTPEFGHVFSS